MYKWKVDRKWEEAGRPHDNGDFVKILLLRGYLYIVVNG